MYLNFEKIFIHICLAWPHCIKSSSTMTLYAIGVYWPFQESINTHSVAIKCHSTSTSYINQMVLWPPCSTPYLTVLWCSERRDKQTKTLVDVAVSSSTRNFFSTKLLVIQGQAGVEEWNIREHWTIVTSQAYVFDYEKQSDRKKGKILILILNLFAQLCDYG